MPRKPTIFTVTTQPLDRKGNPQGEAHLFPEYASDGESAWDVRREHAGDRTKVVSVRRATSAEIAQYDEEAAAESESESQDLAFAESGGSAEMMNDLWAERAFGGY